MLRIGCGCLFCRCSPKNTVRYDSSFNFKDLDRKHLIDVQTPQGGLTKLF